MSWSGRNAQELSKIVLAEYGSLCHLCLKSIETQEEYSVDHIIPRSKGGTNDLDNLRPAHRKCNYSRSDRSIEEFRSSNTDELDWFESLES